MGFKVEFEKVAAKKKKKYDYKAHHHKMHKGAWSLEEKVGRQTLRYHPTRRRWSCDCPDFNFRRQHVADHEDPQDKSCIHIKAHLLGTTPTAVRAEEVANDYKLHPDKIVMVKAAAAEHKIEDLIALRKKIRNLDAVYKKLGKV